jgi:rod shape-determining protein MreD
MNPTQGGWVILLTVLVALLLSVAHLPEGWPGWLGWLRPNWLLLVTFFWVVELPHRVGMIAMWLLGVFLDILLAQPLGLNGLVLATTTYVAWRFFERLRMYSILQQCGVLFLLVLVAELFRAVVLGLDRERPWDWRVLLVPTMTTLLWPFAYLLLLRVRTTVRIE